MNDSSLLRPWGRADWLFQKEPLVGKEWLVIGSVSTQQRCLSIFRHHRKTLSVKFAGCIEIVDNNAPPVFSADALTRRQINKNLIDQELALVQRDFVRFGLLDPIASLKLTVKNWVLSANTKNVIFDVSALPERFLFPTLRWLRDTKEIENLVVTYMLPESYTKDELAYNPGEWGQLPTFIGDGSQNARQLEKIIVGVGFIPFGLPELIKNTYQNPNKADLSLIFPFPSSPQNIRRGWEFVRQIEVSLPLNDDAKICRVAANDLSGCFDRLQLITRKGTLPAIFAPYGPKPHSVAMCLQAINMEAEVYYTQPAYYHPEYSIGMAQSDGLTLGYAYAIKLNDVDLYK